jgi:NAD(P)-dependent dehydrogenase (short-subunit alcohol dehydrogenase family)
MILAGILRREASMQGKTIVMTGATSGIGEVAAVMLARMGARIVFVARHPLRAEATLSRLRSANPEAGHVAVPADLSRLSGMQNAAAEIADLAPKIDVLINNAGAMIGTREVTQDGLELTFAVNHLAYFVLTCLLLPNLRAAAAARIVCTASRAHVGAKLDFSDLQSKNGYFAYAAYAKSKLCNILFVHELAHRLEGTPITVNALHPGFVATRFADNVDGLLRAGFGLAKKMGAISPEEGAQTILYLAASPEVAGRSGGYYFKCAPTVPSAEAQNPAVAKKLWEASAKISGVDFS